MNLLINVSSKVKKYLVMHYSTAKDEDITAIYRNITEVYAKVISVKMSVDDVGNFSMVKQLWAMKNEKADRVKLTSTQSILFASWSKKIGAKL